MTGALAAGIMGQIMLFWAIERTSLVAFEASVHGQAERAPFSTYVVMFLGLIILNFSVFFALTHWSRYLRRNPDVKQLPVWLLFSVAVVASAALLTGIANHSAFIQSHEVIPMRVDFEFIAFQVAMGTLVLLPMVLLAVRWSPGYRHYPVDEEPRSHLLRD